MEQGRTQIFQQVEEAAKVTKQEKQVIDMVSWGRWNRYRLSVFKLDGKLNMADSMMRYAKIMKQWKEFRTVYSYRNTTAPERVVLRETPKAFPVHDVSFLNEKKQTFLIKNVMAALARHTFDLETDPILQLHGFLLDENEIMIVAADYPYLPVSYGVRNLLCEIFKGMHMNNADAPVINEQDVQKMNERFVEKNLQYWKQLLLPLGREMTVPGEQLVMENETGETRYYGELGTDMVCEITAYCRKTEVAMESLFLSIWGKILGNYNEIEQPVLAVRTSGEHLKLFPVKVDRTRPTVSGVQYVHAQLKESKKNSGCTKEQLEKELGISFGTYFHMIQEFIRFSAVDALQGKAGAADMTGDMFGGEEDGIAIQVIYQMFGETIGIVYQSKNGMFEQVLQQLHKLFITELSQMLQEKNELSKEPLQMNGLQSPEEFYRVYRQQIVDVLAKIGLFNCISREALNTFANVCKLQTYLANDVLIDRGKECPGFYVVAEGNIEESMIASDGMVKSIRMLNPGDWFGVECLLDRQTSTSTFMVAGKEAKLIYIDQKILKELFRVRPEGWIKVLEDENRQKKIYQKLWMME